MIHRKFERVEELQVMVSNLKDHTAWGMIQAMERASERVSSWPEWKRTGFSLGRREDTVAVAEHRSVSSTEAVESVGDSVSRTNSD